MQLVVFGARHRRPGLNHLPDMFIGWPWVRCPPAVEVEPHEGVAGLQQRQEHRLVHLAAANWAARWQIRAEQLLGAFDGNRFNLIDIFAAAVIALARIAFGILVGQDRALRLAARPAR